MARFKPKKPKSEKKKKPRAKKPKGGGLPRRPPSQAWRAYVEEPLPW